MRYDFRTPDLVIPGFHVSAFNVVDDEWGIHLYCQPNAGTYFMIDQPKKAGLWQVHSRISAGAANPSTKVCELLWPEQSPDKSAARIWPPEIDFNESGDRTASHQTLHYGTRDQNFMHHTGYSVDQTQWHTYGVRVLPGQISYLLDGVERAHVDQDVPASAGYNDLGWNMHVRTEPNGSQDFTKMDVRWVEIPD
jgi:hypothetical protein